MTKSFKPLKEYGYSPQINIGVSNLLRRLAWYYKKPMSTTLEELICKASLAVNLDDICAACKAAADDCVDCLVIEGALYHKDERPL